MKEIVAIITAVVTAVIASILTGCSGVILTPEPSKELEDIVDTVTIDNGENADTLSIKSNRQK